MEESAHNADTLALTSAIARGNVDAFARFYELWFASCCAKARAITKRDEAFCLDVVQEVMLRVIHKMRPLATAKELENWMARVIYTTSVDLLRKDLRRAKREFAVAKPGNAVSLPQPLQDIQEQIQWLDLEVARLPSLEKNLFHLRFRKNLTLQATSKELGLSIHETDGRLRKIVKRLRSLARGKFHATL